MASKIDFCYVKLVAPLYTVKISGLVSLKVIKLLIQLTFFGEIWQLYVEMNSLYRAVNYF